MRKFLLVSKCVLVIIGTIIGAGFISGRELISFFGSSFFLPSVYIAVLVFFFSVYLMLSCGSRLNGFENMNKTLFQKYSKITKIILLAGSFIIASSMLAGIDSIMEEIFNFPKTIPIFSILTVAISVLILQNGINGIEKINIILVPFIVIFILSVLLKRQSFEYQFSPTGENLKLCISPIIYIGMNIFLSAPVLCDIGNRQKKYRAISSALAAILLGICITLILASIYFEGASAINADMPLLYVLLSDGFFLGVVFAVISYFGIVTTLLSSLYPLLSYSTSCKKPKLITAVLCVGVFCLSRVGLKGLVSYIYPVLGIIGIIYLIITAILYKIYLNKSKNNTNE